MSTEPQNIYLSKKEHKIVKSLSRRKYKRDKISQNEKYHFLKYYDLITYSDSKHTHYVLNPRGRSYLNHYAKDRNRFLVATWLSIAALILSFISIIISIIALQAGS